MRIFVDRRSKALNFNLIFIWSIFWTIISVQFSGNYFSDRLIGTGGDDLIVLWQSETLFQELSAFNFSFTTNQNLYPIGYDYKLSDGLITPLAYLVPRIFFEPIPAYNLTVIIFVLLNFVTSGVLANIYSKRILPSLAASIAFGTVPFLVLRLYGHPHLICAWIACLILITLELGLRDKISETRFKILISLGLFLAFLANISIFISSFLMVLIMITFVSYQKKLHVSKRQLAIHLLKQITSIALMVAIMISPFFYSRIPFIIAENKHRNNDWQITHYIQLTKDLSADLLSFFVQPSGTRFSIDFFQKINDNFYPNRLEVTTFPGFALLIFGLFGLLVLARRKEPQYAILFLLFSSLALGPELRVNGNVYVNGITEKLLPFNFVQVIPLLDSIRTPGRFAILTPVLAIPGFVLLFNKFFKSRMQQKIGLIGVTLTCLTNLVVVPSSSLPATDLKLRFASISQESQGTFLTVPFDCTGNYAPLVYQIYHKHNLMGCLAQASSVPWYSDFSLYYESQDLMSLTCESSRYGYASSRIMPTKSNPDTLWNDLKSDFDVEFVLVDKNFLASPVCEVNRFLIQTYLDNLAFVAEDSAWILMRVY